MKILRMTTILALILALTAVPATAEGSLSGRIEGNTLTVTWNDAGDGQAVLTVYQNDWPICLEYVEGAEGRMTVGLGEVSGRYSLSINGFNSSTMNFR